MPTKTAGRLTISERAVMHYHVRGFTREEIAGRLSVSLHTIDAHLRNAKHKLDARNMAQAGARYAILQSKELLEVE